MTIASSAIAATPLAGHTIGTVFVAAQRLSLWENAQAGHALMMPYSIRLEVGSAQKWAGLTVNAQRAHPFGALMAAAADEQLWDPCTVVRSSLSAGYGTWYASMGAATPYGNAPLKVSFIIPYRFTTAARRSAEWSSLPVVVARCESPWATITHVEMQKAMPYRILQRTLVVGSSSQVWNLSDIRNVLIHGSAVRAFHKGIWI
ncbi:MAG: hypothetical protein HQL96_10880 [Magnetococcales bacterium]|nr:hypothetical protein [Magnetococcales bacterium]